MATGGALMVVVVGVFLVFLVMLFVAPIKLYGIHSEARNTNDLLRRQNTLLAQISEHHQTQIRLLATIANQLTAGTSVQPPARS